MPWLLPLLGIALFSFLAVICAAAVHGVIWQGKMPWSELPPPDANLILAETLAVLSLILVAGIGMSPGFLNLSSVNAFYAGRLIRAYLGASNPVRLKASRISGISKAKHKHTGGEKNKSHSVQQNHPADNIAPHIYHDGQILAPVHLINITMNQTVSPNSQLVQQDRKGRNFVVGPDGVHVDDHQLSANKPDGEPKKESAAEKFERDLQIGQWAAISGAAASTGMGQGTSLGTALLFAFANIRLGYWWPAPDMPDNKNSSGNTDKKKTNFFRRLFETHCYLLAEMTARYDPVKQRRLYLSDGGHFENTAAYELIRRQVPLILLSDAGCDPNYMFDDLANLIRKARIDFGTEMTVLDDKEIQKIFPNSHQWISQPDNFDDKEMAKADACAVAFRLGYQGGKTGYLLSLKPRLTSFASLDVHNYAANNPAFPQEPTADQFFDEAQWESYRKLGYDIATTLFAQPSASGLW